MIISNTRSVFLITALSISSVYLYSISPAAFSKGFFWIAHPRPPKKADTNSGLERLPVNVESPFTSRAGMTLPAASWYSLPSPALICSRTQRSFSSAAPSGVMMPPFRPSTYSPKTMLPRAVSPWRNSGLLMTFLKDISSNSPMLA